MDYAAFLWAEAIVALSLVAVSFAGFLQERPPALRRGPEPAQVARTLPD